MPIAKDKRVMAVPVGCGYCIECKKKKARDWQIRLYEEIKHSKLKGHMITLTFSEQALKRIRRKMLKAGHKMGYELENATASYAVRRFTELWRKHNKKTVRHWLITELGHQGTERIHLHGIIWIEPERDKNEIQKHWKHGIVWAGYENEDTYVNEKTVNYMIKYVTKTDEVNKYYQPKIYASKGIGNKWSGFGKEYNGIKTKDNYTTETGHKMSLPIYYRNKIYSDEEREDLWLNKLDEQVRYVMGIKIDISNGEQEYYKIVQQKRERMIQLGIDKEFKFDEKQYEEKRRTMLQLGQKIEEKEEKIEIPISEENWN